MYIQLHEKVWGPFAENVNNLNKIRVDHTICMLVFYLVLT